MHSLPEAGMQYDDTTRYCSAQALARRCWLGRRPRSVVRRSSPSHRRPSPRSGGNTALLQRTNCSAVTVCASLQHGAALYDAFWTAPAPWGPILPLQHQARIDCPTAKLCTARHHRLGDGVRYTRALFSLAAKLSPCVIFIDEVDALLGAHGIACLDCKADSSVESRRGFGAYLAQRDGCIVAGSSHVCTWCHCVSLAASTWHEQRYWKHLISCNAGWVQAAATRTRSTRRCAR